jgi:hypothetical protein
MVFLVGQSANGPSSPERLKDADGKRCSTQSMSQSHRRGLVCSLFRQNTSGNDQSAANAVSFGVWICNVSVTVKILRGRVRRNISPTLLTRRRSADVVGPRHSTLFNKPNEETKTISLLYIRDTKFP